MGYGFGGILIVVGLILALAVDETISGVDVHTVGWIMTVVGAVLVALTAVTLNNDRRSKSVATTTHPDGSQTVQERRNEV